MEEQGEGYEKGREMPTGEESGGQDRSKVGLGSRESRNKEERKRVVEESRVVAT